MVALLTALFELTRNRVPTQSLAETACDIEMNLANHPVGKHDHYLAAFGGLTTLEIEPGECARHHRWHRRESLGGDLCAHGARYRVVALGRLIRAIRNVHFDLSKSAFTCRGNPLRTRVQFVVRNAPMKESRSA